MNKRRKPRASNARLIGLEFRKLFMPKRLVFAAFILLCGGLWLYPFQVLYPGPQFPDYETRIAAEMEAKYGTLIDDREWEAFKQDRAEKIAEADAYIQADPLFAAANLDSYERYMKRGQMPNGGTLELDAHVRSGPKKELFEELRKGSELIVRYEDDYRWTMGKGTALMNEAERQRLQEIEARSGVSVLPSSVFYAYASSGILYRLAMTAMLTTALLVMHIHIGDRRAGLSELQGTSRVGRNKLLRIKTAAALLIGTMVSAILLAVLLIAYRFSDAWDLMGADISGRFNFLFMYDLTFLQYILLTYGAVFVLSWIAALLTAFYSAVAPNLQLLAAAIVVTLFFFFKGDFILNRLLDFMLYGSRPLLEPSLILGGLLLLGIALTWVAQKQETWRWSR
ncbi:hypothetical protein CDO73_17305 [Saccharibacillus sp. O23]|uniref:hypothetical protein n=1 Tax=Saccharibacillus sp. O23 TaxID=2009338 RepID=UPI000B4E482C|nr:hypothetical protein [Saccharibacillus sp. O23]OWR28659.1 hypothetical protein CDO73_17305 [Saccharibacillus sp. O23]